MDLSGRLYEVKRDFKSSKVVVSFIINENLGDVDELGNRDVAIKIGTLSKARSLDSNKYFHVLCDKLRIKNGISMAHQKNELIALYGQIEYLDDEPLIYKTNAAPEYMCEREEVHTSFIKYTDAYWYRIYRGTHTYNSIEMNYLIEGTVEECKAKGIETATPDELARMAELWKAKYERKTKERKSS